MSVILRILTATRPKFSVSHLLSSPPIIVELTLPGFLMILLSTTIYTAPPALPTTTNLPLEHLTHSLERRLVLSLLCSLLNTSLTPSKVNSGVTGQLPYNHLISKGAEERRTLVRASLMTLLVALDYRQVSVSGSEQIMGEGKDENAFRYFVSKLVSVAGPRLGGRSLMG